MNATVSVLTLGCRVNQYESDSMCARLRSLGVRIVPFGDPADVAVVNTCTVTAESDRKSRQMIRRAAQNAARVVVTGCFAQVDPDAAAEMDGVVYVCGNEGKASLADTVYAILGGRIPETPAHVDPPVGRHGVEMTLTAPMRTRSYIKIEDGCNNRCSYCLIRTARGPVRSKDPALVLEEAASLARAGAKEVILTGIEAASYGMDFSDRKPYGHALADLIRGVQQIAGIERIGLGSLEPTVMNEVFCEAARDCPKLLPHFHLSVQSGSDPILAAMRRRYRAETVLGAIRRMKEARPDVTFSADIIVGFPGETEEQYAETEAFCREARFLHLHIFPFSKRDGTEAAAMEDQVPEKSKHERAARLEAVGAEIRGALLAEYVDAHRETPVKLLVEKCAGGMCSGHSEHFVELKKIPGKAGIGEIVPVLLDGTDGAVCTGHFAE
ncbi:MAG: tRNA (N(6)-L-threonylcarbamoyladenosine(37)-C(2))-methylthiotransferase MtaB [Clostridia bacterium]|nr:tRNA (N(6)-L-threonylcarbamoyladenosine(37)-C(2))-methylthiotransferase MtaB [Clostridia bacterium]